MSEIIKSRFIIVKHQASRAGLHTDIRFKKPDSDMWISFATRKEIPTQQNQKILLIKTHDHNEKDATNLDEIKDGYGKGTYSLFDQGDCNIIKWHPRHIVVEFKGKKIKGVYHVLGIANITRDFKSTHYLFFKAKDKTLKECECNLKNGLEIILDEIKNIIKN